MHFWRAEIYKLTLKFIWKCKIPRITKTTLMKKNNLEDLLPDSKTYYKATTIKITWHWVSR